MTLTLLIDLDDTLLGNAIDTFVPAYTQALAKKMARHAEPGRLIRQLMHATSMMVQNTDPRLTLEQVFDRHFYPALAIDRQVVQPTIDQFYAQEFPRLKSITTFRQEAVDLVSQSFRQDMQVAIATNPIFPRTAIEQRLDWAGLPADQFPFQIIPSYQDFHFAKPNPAFFAEILGQIGWLSGPVVMVGNDIDSDIQPARELGLATYLVTPNSGATSPDPESRHAQGRLADVLSWMNQLPEDTLLPEFKTPKALTINLRVTLAALTSLTRRFTGPGWKTRPAAGEWSLTEIICHLRDVESEVNLSRLERVRQGNNPFIAGRDTDSWASERNYQDQDGLTALEEFITRRMSLVEIVENLSTQEWDLPARHAIFGPIRLCELIEIIINHDRIHINTIRQIAP